MTLSFEFSYRRFINASLEEIIQNKTWTEENCNSVTCFFILEKHYLRVWRLWGHFEKARLPLDGTDIG